MLSRCHVSPGALHEGRLFPITWLLLGKQMLSFGYFKLCNSPAWKRRENSLVEVRNSGDCAGSTRPAAPTGHSCICFRVLFPSWELTPLQGGTSQCRIPCRTSLSQGRCGRNSPGFPPAHTPWYSRLELVNLIGFLDWILELSVANISAARTLVARLCSSMAWWGMYKHLKHPLKQPGF